MLPTSQTVPVRGKELCVHTWLPGASDGVDLSAVVCVIYHGFRAHGLYPTVRYAADRLAAAGYIVVAPDLPGHGQSPGLAGYLPDAESLIDDCFTVAEYARDRHGRADRPAKLFLLGSSMGGTIALSVARMSGADEIAGVVLLAPMLRLSVGAPSRYLLWALSHAVPTWEVIPSSSTDAEKQYRDPIKRKECEDDELTGKGDRIRVGAASTCVELASNIQYEFPAISCPFLLMVADEDVIVNNQGSLDLFEKAASTDKTMKNFAALHGLLCEPSPLVDTIEKEMVDWIKERT